MHPRKHHGRKPFMLNRYLQLAFLGSAVLLQSGRSYTVSAKTTHQGAQDSSAQQVNPVVQWNRALLVIVRTPGAQSPTVHPTRSFPTMHAAIYDAVNAIDRKHRPYLVRLSNGRRDPSQKGAAAASAHECLARLYPDFKAPCSAAVPRSLQRTPAGACKHPCAPPG